MLYLHYIAMCYEQDQLLSWGQLFKARLAQTLG